MLKLEMFRTFVKSLLHHKGTCGKNIKLLMTCFVQNVQKCTVIYCKVKMLLLYDMSFISSLLVINCTIRFCDQSADFTCYFPKQPLGGATKPNCGCLS